MKIKLRKIDEPFEARNKHNVAVGATMEGYLKSELEVGKNFILFDESKERMKYATSPVVEIINKERNIFKTWNSIYQYEVMGE